MLKTANRVTFCLLLCSCAFAQVGKLKTFSDFEWTQGSEAYIFTTNVGYDDFITIALGCETGQYIHSCGLPEIIRDGGNIKFSCAPAITNYETTENYCTVVAPFAGTAQITIPVLQRGIEYHGTVSITEGP